MTIKQFIEKAIEGGWKREEKHLEETSYGADFNYSAILLDPLAWQAVGKVEGWGDEEQIRKSMFRGRDYKTQMNGLTPALIDGKSIEQYLDTL